MNDVHIRILRALKATASYAVVFLAMDLLHVLTNGREVLDQWHFSLLGLLAFYAFATVSVAVVIGILQPLTKYRLGPHVVGFVAMLPLSFMFFSFFFTEEETRGAIPLTSIAFSLIYGVLGGMFYRGRLSETNTPKPGEVRSNSLLRTALLCLLLATLILFWLDLEFGVINK